MTSRSNRILENEQFQKLLCDITKIEQDRVFCHHDLEHVTEVNRIVQLLYKRNGGTSENEADYLSCAAYLHDIGRVQKDIPHEEASARMAVSILKEEGYEDEECGFISSLIMRHRGNHDDESADRLYELGSLLKEADRLSRACYACDAASDCYWPLAKRNTERFI